MNSFFRNELATIIILVLFVPIPARGDAAVNIKPDGYVFRSSSGRVHATLVQQGKKILVDRNSVPMYEVAFGEIPFERGDIYVSNGGETLIWMLAASFPGHLVSDKSFGEQQLNSPGLIFFRYGKCVKSYSLRELLVRPNLVAESGSHSSWLDPASNNPSRRRHNPKFINNENEFELQTTSFRSYVFDCEKGEIQKSEDISEWRDSDIIGCAKLVHIKANKWRIDDIWTIKGEARNISTITILDTTRTYVAKWQTIAIRQSGKYWLPVAPESKLPWHCYQPFSN